MRNNRSRVEKGFSVRNLETTRASRRFMFLLMWSFSVIWILSTASAYAATLCVNSGGTDGCYALPSAAVAAAAADDVIVVHPGTYQELGTINITKALKIAGDNPTNTKVTNAMPANVFTISTGTGVPAEISGLMITGGLNGIQVSGNSGSLTFHHNHIEFNGGGGITTTLISATILAYNNVILSNNGTGISTGSTGVKIVAYNNIVAKNGSTGIGGNFAAVSYNSSFGNGTNGTQNYGTISGNIGNLTLDCLFVGTTDYRLQTASPCIDTGNPGFVDVDGTRSDMGSFGGPLAAAFWPYGNGGPVITDLTIDPVIVPRGGTLSISATGEIR